MSRSSECNLPGDIVVADEHKRTHIMKQLAHWCRGKYFEANNPVMMPVHLTRDNLGKLRKEEYVVAEKSDGVRYNLCLGVYKRLPYAVLIDRSTNIFEIDICAQRRFFEGTVLDGELVWDFKHKKQRFLVFDVPSVAGQWIGGLSYSDRYKVIDEIIGIDGASALTVGVAEWLPFVTKMAMDHFKVIAVGNKHQLTLERKLCFPLDMLPTLWRQITQNTLNHNCDGLIFTPVNRDFRVGRNMKQLKFKPLPTIDVALKGNCTWLLCEESGQWVPAAYETVHPIIFERNTPMSKAIFNFATVHKKALIVECQFEVPKALRENSSKTSLVHPIVCLPVRIRDDKQAPNMKSMVEGMIKDFVAHRNVGMADILQSLEAVVQ